jgi:hypothetical protein
MLRNTFVIVVALGVTFGGLISTASAVNPAKVTPAPTNTLPAMQAALRPAAKRHHKHHHHKKAGAAAVVPAVK